MSALLSLNTLTVFQGIESVSSFQNQQKSVHQSGQTISLTFFLPHFITSAARRFWSLSELIVTDHDNLSEMWVSFNIYQSSGRHNNKHFYKSLSNSVSVYHEFSVSSCAEIELCGALRNISVRILPVVFETKIFFTRECVAIKIF